MEYVVATLVSIFILETWMIVKLLAEKKDLRIKLEKCVEVLSLLQQSKGESEYEITTKREPSGSKAENKIEDDLSDEEHVQMIAQLQKVKLICKSAEIHLQDLNDDSSIERLKSRIELASEAISKIADDFYRNAALHSVVVLCHNAGFQEDANRFYSQVNDQMIRDEIKKDIGGTYT